MLFPGERVNLSHGPLMRELMVFSAPILLTGVLQLAFNFADMVVVGRFASAKSLGAVGVVSQLAYLCLVTFMGMSIGANVVVANQFGAKNDTGVSRASHTAVTLAMICGIVVGIADFCLARPALLLIDTPADILERSEVYFRIISLGMPFSLLFNVSAAILRAVGDTKTSLYSLTSAGVLNLVLNLILVIYAKMDVAGVAIATVISNLLSAGLVMRKLFVIREACRIEVRKLGIDWMSCRNILKVGLPAGLQSMMYGLGSIIIQKGVNSFGSLAMAGSAASSTLEGVIFTGINSFDQSITTAVGQNSGARKFGRLVKSFYYCTTLMAAYVFLVGGVAFIFAEECIGLFNSDPEAIAFGAGRLRMMSILYILDGVMINITSTLRALGHSVFPAAVTVAGALIFRVAWVFLVFPLNRTMMFLWSCMPISWILISCINGTYLHKVLKKLRMSHMR